MASAQRQNRMSKSKKRENPWLPKGLTHASRILLTPSEADGNRTRNHRIDSRAENPMFFGLFPWIRPHFSRKTVVGKQSQILAFFLGNWRYLGRRAVRKTVFTGVRTVAGPGQEVAKTPATGPGQDRRGQRGGRPLQDVRRARPLRPRHTAQFPVCRGLLPEDGSTNGRAPCRGVYGGDVARQPVCRWMVANRRSLWCASWELR